MLSFVPLSCQAFNYWIFIMVMLFVFFLLTFILYNWYIKFHQIIPLTFLLAFAINIQITLGNINFFPILCCFVPYVVPSMYSSSSVKFYDLLDWVYMFTVEFNPKCFGEIMFLIAACCPLARFWPHPWEGWTLGCPCLALHSSHPQTECGGHSQRSLAEVWPEFLHQVSHSLGGVWR